MLRKFLAREKQFLLDEFNAPDIRTLGRRVVFWVYFITFVGLGLSGVMAVYYLFGLPAMYGVIFLLYLLCVRLEGRRPFYFDGGQLGPGGDPALPPPGKQALPPQGARQIARSNQALTKHRPALPKRSP